VIDERNGPISERAVISVRFLHPFLEPGWNSAVCRGSRVSARSLLALRSICRTTALSCRHTDDGSSCSISIVIVPGPSR
jgi:hypothetical protein